MVVTFITSSDVALCARVLNNKSLGKQRVEAKQILDVVLGTTTTKGWKSHPAALMWMGYGDALKLYINAMIDEWISRGYKNTMTKYQVNNPIIWPWWFSWGDLHLSHKCSLLRKNPSHYEKIWQLEEDDLPFLKYGYIWITHLSAEIVEKIQAGTLFNPEVICDPIGTGAPAQYRWTREEVAKWMASPNVNPKTGKKINPDSKSGIAADLHKAKAYYQISEIGG